MGLSVQVPLSTTLADLDEALRVLLKRELERHGFSGVEIVFDAPSREWSGKLTGPTVNMFLYDLREVADQAVMGLTETRVNGRAELPSPDLRLESTYAITAWTKAIEDEHRLLSQILAILHSHRVLPDDLLDGRLASAGTIETTLGRPMEEKADFWSAVGGQYKPSIDFAVRMSIESGATFVRGPEVRVQTMRPHLADAPVRTLEELTRFGGKVTDGDGQPVGNAWVAIPSLGVWTSTNREGRYIFDRVRGGTYTVVVRTADGGEAQASIKVPSKDTDLVLGSPGKGKRSKS